MTTMMNIKSKKVTTDDEVEGLGVDAFWALALSLRLSGPYADAVLIVLAEQVRHVVVFLRRHLRQPLVRRFQRLPDLHTR